MQREHALRAFLSVVLVLGVVAVLSGQSSRQLYLVSGLATSKQVFTVPTALFAVDDRRQAIVHVAELVDQAQGSHFITADHDLRLVILGTPSIQPRELVVLSMDAPTTPRRLPIEFEGGLLEAVLFTDGDGRAVQGLFTMPANQQWRLLGVDVNGTGPLQELPWEVYRSIRTEGFWSPGDLHTYVRLYPKDGKLLLQPHVSTVDLGISPPVANGQPEAETLILSASNDDVLVIAHYGQKSGAPEPVTDRLSIYERKTARWHTLSLPGAGASVRAFGPWVVSARSERKRVIAVNGIEEVDSRSEKESPGNAFRRTPLNPKARRQDQTTIDFLFQDVPFYFPGELLLYDVRSGLKYAIKTDQGDSEVLLIDGESVYYRVNDNLYRATITKSAIENPVKILTDDKVQLSHWAFFGPPVSQ